MMMVVFIYSRILWSHMAEFKSQCLTRQKLGIAITRRGDQNGWQKSPSQLHDPEESEMPFCCSFVRSFFH